jgi:predicted HTH transcriptional regulator
VACGPEDVIENDGKQGYCLRDWIAVKFVQRKAPVADADDEQTPVARRKRILAALTKRAMKLPDLTSVLRVSAKTVARTLNELRADGLVEFVGSRKTGQYQVKG